MNNLFSVDRWVFFPLSSSWSLLFWSWFVFFFWAMCSGILDPWTWDL